MITKATKDYIETDSGQILPLLFDLEEKPPVKEIRKLWAEWEQIFKTRELFKND